MRQFFYKISLFIFYLATLFAGENKQLAADEAQTICGRLAISTGLEFGKTEEYVYANRIMLSELSWPLSPAYTLNIEGDILFKNGIHITAFFSGMPPVKTRTMTDSDYLNSAYGDTARTHFSEHECRLRYGIQTGLKFGIALPVEPTLQLQQAGVHIILEPHIGIRYIRYKWNAYNGYTQYPPEYYPGPYSPWNPGIPKKTFTGDAVQYTQQLLCPTLGFSLDTKLPKNCFLSWTVQCCAQIIGNAEDIHMASSKHTLYKDFFHEGFSGHSDILFSWKWSEHNGLFASFRYSFIYSSDGFTVQYNALDTSIPTAIRGKGASGISFNAGTLSLGWIFFFGY